MSSSTWSSPSWSPALGPGVGVDLRLLGSEVDHGVGGLGALPQFPGLAFPHTPDGRRKGPVYAA